MRAPTRTSPPPWPPPSSACRRSGRGRHSGGPGSFLGWRWSASLATSVRRSARCGRSSRRPARCALCSRSCAPPVNPCCASIWEADWECPTERGRIRLRRSSTAARSSARCAASTRALLTKRGSGGRRFAVADAGMNDLLRPALYGAYHAVETVARPRAKSEVIDLVGPVCESADVLAARRRLPPLRSGDLLVLRTAGAYAMSMASQYNARPRPAEVLVSGSRFRVVRRRETQSDLVRGETV